MKKMLLTIAILMGFSFNSLAFDVNVAELKNFFVDKGYKDPDPTWSFPNVTSLAKGLGSVIIKNYEDGSFKSGSFYLKDASAFDQQEAINDAIGFFTKLMGNRKTANQWVNDCVLGLNYNKDVKTSNYDYFCYKSGDLLTMALTTV